MVISQHETYLSRVPCTWFWEIKVKGNDRNFTRMICIRKILGSTFYPSPTLKRLVRSFRTLEKFSVCQIEVFNPTDQGLLLVSSLELNSPFPTEEQKKEWEIEGVTSTS